MSLLSKTFLFLAGSGLIVYGFMLMIRVWPRDFFISERSRTRRSFKAGFAGALQAFGIFLLLLLFLDEEVSSYRLIGTLLSFGAISVVIGAISGISTYSRLWLLTKTKDDIGTIREQ